LISDWLEEDSDFSDESSDEDGEDEEMETEKEMEKDKKKDKQKGPRKPTKVDVDLNLSAFANARRYYEQKKMSSVKHQKTMDASKKARVFASHNALELS